MDDVEVGRLLRFGPHPAAHMRAFFFFPSAEAMFEGSLLESFKGKAPKANSACILPVLVGLDSTPIAKDLYRVRLAMTRLPGQPLDARPRKIHLFSTPSTPVIKELSPKASTWDRPKAYGLPPDSLWLSPIQFLCV